LELIYINTETETETEMEFDSEMLADIEKKLYDDNDNRYELPITEIDGVRVIVEIYKTTWRARASDTTETVNYYLNIRLKGVYNKGDENLNHEYLLFNSQCFAELAPALKYAIIFLGICKMDLVRGKLVVETNTEGDTSAKLSALFRSNTRLKVKHDECCVCKDTETTTRTECGHPVCVRCISKLPMADEEPDFDEETMWCERKCPMCRTGFYTIDD
jgi:hypothetical protein